MVVPLRLCPTLLAGGDLVVVEVAESQVDHKWPQQAYPIVLLKFDGIE
tara:strand:+ start:420 stop:563 length:144 start_codon:yes stop_codon:yes gene_type:complete